MQSSQHQQSVSAKRKDFEIQLTTQEMHLDAEQKCCFPPNNNATIYVQLNAACVCAVHNLSCWHCFYKYLLQKHLSAQLIEAFNFIVTY